MIAPRTRAPGPWKCPKCEGGTAVTDSRPNSHGGIRRRRKCLDCGHRITTHEVSADVFGDLNVEELRLLVVTNMNTMIESFGRLNRAIKAHAKLKEVP